MPGPWIRTNGFMALAFSCCLCFPSATPTQQIMIDVGANSVGRACLGGESAFSIAFPQGSFADDGTVNLTAITAASDPEQYDNLIGMAAAGQDFLSVVDMSDTFFIISAQEQPLKDAIMSLGIPPSLTQPYQAASDADVRVAYINGYEDDDVELELAPGFAPFAAFLNESSLITTLAPEVFTAGAGSNSSTAMAVVYLTITSSIQLPAIGAGRGLKQGGKEPCTDDCKTTPRSQTKTATCRLQPPVKGATISSGYQNRINPVTGKKELHQGIDYSVGAGTPVYAAHDGTVIIRQGYMHDTTVHNARVPGSMPPRRMNYFCKGGVDVQYPCSFGYFIIITSPCQTSLYGHLTADSAIVENGTCVKAGDLIGSSGSTGFSTGPHLHFQYSQSTGIFGNKGKKNDGAVLGDPTACFKGQCFCSIQGAVSGSCSATSTDSSPCAGDEPTGIIIDDVEGSPTTVHCSKVKGQTPTTYVYDSKCKFLAACDATSACPDGFVCVDSPSGCNAGSQEPLYLCAVEADLANCGRSF